MAGCRYGCSESTVFHQDGLLRGSQLGLINPGMVQANQHRVSPSPLRSVNNWGQKQSVAREYRARLIPAKMTLTKPPALRLSTKTDHRDTWRHQRTNTNTKASVTHQADPAKIQTKEKGERGKVRKESAESSGM